MDIDGKTVLVTGTARGIGRALVEELLERGAKKVYAGARGELRHADARVAPLLLDVTQREQVFGAAHGVPELDLLINNAGILLFDNLFDPQAISRHIAVNVLGPLAVTQAFLPQLQRARGAVVNVLSLAAIAPVPVTPAYSLSKAAGLSMTQSLRVLLAARGVKLHAVLAGPVDTDMSRGVEVPKASPAQVAAGILDGLARNEEEIFPDIMARRMADAWNTGLPKAMEREFVAFAPKEAA